MTALTDKLAEIDSKRAIADLVIAGDASGIPPGTVADQLQAVVDNSNAQLTASFAATNGATKVNGTWFGNVVATVAQLASSIGASLIGFIQAAVGAVSRSVQDKLRETVSIKDFGAKGDGSSCVAAMRAALAYLSSIGGGTLLIPDGVYLLDAASLTSDPSATVSSYNYWFQAVPNVTVQGGRGAVLKVDAGVVNSDAAKQYCKGYQIFWAWSVGTVPNFTVRGLTIDCNGVNNLAPVPNTYGSGIQTHVVVSNCAKKWKVEDLHVLSTSGYQCIAFYLGCTDIEVRENHFYDMASSIVGNTNLHDHSTIYCEADSYLFADNRFINTNFDVVATAIEAHGFNGVVRNNYVKRYNLMHLRAAMVGDSYNVLSIGNVGDEVTIGLQYDAGAGRRLEVLDIGSQARLRDASETGTRTPGAINTAGGFAGRTGTNYTDIRIKHAKFYAPASITSAGNKAILGGNVDYLLIEKSAFFGFAKHYEAGNFVDGSSVIMDGNYIDGATDALITHGNYVAGAANANVDYRISSLHLSKSPGLTYFISCSYDNAHIRNVSITGAYAIAIQPYTGYYDVVSNYFQVDYTTTSMGSKNVPPFVTGKIYDITHRATFFRDNVADPQRWRIRRPGTAAPTTAFAVGDDHVGDIVENSAPSAGGYMGWACTTQSPSAGTVGTWKGYGAVAA